ncbi:hypothetical protein L873DRAFT_1813436 [Choiromyces venosus 120613-1]|uniref:RRM domain-containing protein n=1 Tax=Choiromyces venosus 120613-1 TaxID=1336337 RepID=A0A3N4J9W6_9PEZI|nr:hypothetical protein L873DRAFT_1813436 [Choiromyces venosus 120613-1]
MQSLRDSSQQDRRVYVGNLSYDVKWHHLKDFMRQAMVLMDLWAIVMIVVVRRGPLRRCLVASEWNVEGMRDCGICH